MQHQSNLTFPRPYRRSDKKECFDSDKRNTRNSADAAVIATNDDAAVSKASCVSAGYFEDRFLRHFVGGSGVGGGGGLTSSSSSSFSPSLPRRPPLINRGYFCRYASFSGLVYAFMSRVAEKKEKEREKTSTTTATRSQVVSIGAGSDTLFFRLHDEGKAPDLYIELDLPEVVSKKAAIIASNQDLASRVGWDPSSSSFDGNGIVTSRYALLPCDLRSPRPLSTAIAKAAAAAAAASSSSSSPSPSPSPSCSSSPFSFDASAPTLFLSECVLVYLPPEAGDEVLRDACEMTTTATMTTRSTSESKVDDDGVSGSSSGGEAAIVVYDPCRPSTPFGRQMRQNLRARGCELAGFDAFEDPRGAEERLRRCGWECGGGSAPSCSSSSASSSTSTSAETLREVWERRLPDEARSRASRIESLDELEEWNLIMGHYFLAVGVKRRSGAAKGEEKKEASRSGAGMEGAGRGGGERGGGVFDGFGLASLRERRTKFTGFSGFPESIVRSKKLRTLWLQDHRAVVVASPGISNLRNLRELAVTMCSLRALPAELGALRGLTRLGFTMNRSYLVGAGGARLRVALK